MTLRIAHVFHAHHLAKLAFAPYPLPSSLLWFRSFAFKAKTVWHGARCLRSGMRGAGPMMLKRPDIILHVQLPDSKCGGGGGWRTARGVLSLIPDLSAGFNRNTFIETPAQPT